MVDPNPRLAEGFIFWYRIDYCKQNRQTEKGAKSAIPRMKGEVQSARRQQVETVSGGAKPASVRRCSNLQRKVRDRWQACSRSLGMQTFAAAEAGQSGAPTV